MCFIRGPRKTLQSWKTCHGAKTSHREGVRNCVCAHVHVSLLLVPTYSCVRDNLRIYQPCPPPAFVCLYWSAGLHSLSVRKNSQTRMQRYTKTSAHAHGHTYRADHLTKMPSLFVCVPYEIREHIQSQHSLTLITNS